MPTQYDELIEFIKKSGGFAKYPDLVKAGFSKAVIAAALDSGQIECISHGIYSLSEIPDIAHPDLVTASIEKRFDEI